MKPWYKVTIPRKEVREGRSFNPDEFTIHLEQVISKTAPQDYRDPKQVFFTHLFYKGAERTRWYGITSFEWRNQQYCPGDDLDNLIRRSENSYSYRNLSWI